MLFCKVKWLIVLLKILELASSPNQSLGSAPVPHVSMLFASTSICFFLLSVCPATCFCGSFCVCWLFKVASSISGHYWYLTFYFPVCPFQHHNFSGMPSYMSMSFCCFLLGKHDCPLLSFSLSTRCLMQVWDQSCCLMDTDGDSWPPRFFICLDSSSKSFARLETCVKAVLWVAQCAPTLLPEFNVAIRQPWIFHLGQRMRINGHL